MMFTASISSSSGSKGNNNKCNKKCICKSAHSIGSDVDCNCSLLTASSTPISAHGSAKQRSSSSYKKYRRAKLRNDVQHSDSGSNNNINNNHDAQRLDHCSSSRSSNSITSLSPATAPTTTTAFSADSTNSCSSTVHRQRRRHVASLTACCSSAASISSIAVALTAGLSICRAFSLSICVLLLLRLAPTVHGLAVGVDTANANLTDLGSPGGYSTTILLFIMQFKLYTHIFIRSPKLFYNAGNLLKFAAAAIYTFSFNDGVVGLPYYVPYYLYIVISSALYQTLSIPNCTGGFVNSDFALVGIEHKLYVNLVQCSESLEKHY
ncbi:uncharacterized protein [Bactrocera oleae]|uniref:uncharacterized protein n=1 Tax=Bactrocera oleae TaxID=104688 RepID=UPI00387E800F